MKPFSINTPMHVFIGEGEISRIPEILNSQDSKAKDVLVLTDRGVKGTGIPEEIVQTIEAAGFRTEFVDTVPQEPFTEDIDTLADRLKGKDIGYVVGVGGGQRARYGQDPFYPAPPKRNDCPILNRKRRKAVWAVHPPYPNNGRNRIRSNSQCNCRLERKTT
ncbi:MAG: iron-containing alcohol dehydrogenase [Spirochaetales bacterium]|nr:iron-containing alcohol dehydrogenase [Spirochaetales bacterium]